MSILDSELKFYQSSVVNDTSSNGSSMSPTVIQSGVIQNVFPNVLSAERTSGSTKYRKLFMKVANDADETLVSAKFWLDNATIGDDWILMFAGTQTDTQADISSPTFYGCANLSTDATSGGSTLVVTVEDASQTGIFTDGAAIRVTDMANPGSTTGNEEFHVVNGTPSVSGLEVTITTTDVLANDYLVTSTARVSTVYTYGDVECSVDNWVETGSGTYDEATYPVICDNIGTIEQTWTLTFTDATNYTISGNTVGALASGTVSSDYSENNPDFSKPYFTLEFAGFGGTWANGDTIVFQTHPASVPIWEKRVVPAGASSLTSNSIVLVVTGESV